MAFRKRNVVLSRATESGEKAEGKPSHANGPSQHPGVRHSPVDGRLTTSTGTPSLDSVLAGHTGLALGHSVLIEESGTTDYAGTLLRHYAAEGIVQGQQVHAMGVGEQWGRELPGLVGPAGTSGSESSKRDTEKMKIAWRYESLGGFDEKKNTAGSRVAVERNPNNQKSSLESTETGAFCHVFDLAKRLEFPPGVRINYMPIRNDASQETPFANALLNLSAQIAASPAGTIHRLVIPTILSPAVYPVHACEPRHLLQFFHGLRGLLRQHPNQLTAMITLPLELYPRQTGLVRWMELLSDGVLELTPFPHLFEPSSSTSSKPAPSSAATTQEDPPQGMLKLHKLPIFHERGGGSGSGVANMGDDLAFTVSRRKFVIKPFNLPPADGEAPVQAEGATAAANIEF